MSETTDKFWLRRTEALKRIAEAESRFIEAARKGDANELLTADDALAAARALYDETMLDWAMLHPKVRYGFCPVCRHNGDDCTGRKR